MPEITKEEFLELATISSAAGLPLSGNRPFRAPHHTSSRASLVGGGEPVKPGELTLAHGGVLFLDELTEFRRSIIAEVADRLHEGLHCPPMPAKPLLIAAMNPCPCGYHGSENRVCSCSEDRIRRHLACIAPIAKLFQATLHVSRIK